MAAFSCDTCVFYVYDDETDQLYCDVEADEDRSGWFDRDFAADQKFMSFGVRNYGQGRVALEGVVLTNLFAAGEVLAGITGIEADAKEIIVKSALDAVANIN